MNISSVILRARPDTLPQLRSELLATPGVEIQADAGDGRLVVTVEDGANHSAADSLLAVHTATGVVSATLVYQYTDEYLNTALTDSEPSTEQSA